MLTKTVQCVTSVLVACEPDQRTKHQHVRCYFTPTIRTIVELGGGLNTIFYKNKRFKNKHFKTIKQKTPSIKNTGGLNDPPVRFYIEESVD